MTPHPTPSAASTPSAATTATGPVARRLLVGVAAAVLALGAVGCSSEGSDDPATPEVLEQPGTDPTSEAPLDLPDGDGEPDLPDLGGDPAASLAEQCDAYVELGGAVAGLGERDVATVAGDFAEIAPIDIGAYAETLAAAIASAGSDPDALTSAETMGALAQVGNFFFDQCELDEQLQITATEDGVSSFPATVTAGRVGIELANMTIDDEPAQLVLARRDDGDDRAVEELEGLTADQLAEDNDPVGVLWTGSSDDTVAWLFDLEPGSYLAVSNLPSGGDEAVSVVAFEVVA